LLKATRVEPLGEPLARAAGLLLHAARSAETIAAVVVATADLQPGSCVLTGDTNDLKRLASVKRATIVIGV
jgi:hypothetical protein